MRERGLHDLAREIRGVASPVPKARAESMGRRSHLHTGEQRIEGHVGERLIGPEAREDEIAAPDLSKNLKSAISERDPVFLLCLQGQQQLSAREDRP